MTQDICDPVTVRYFLPSPFLLFMHPLTYSALYPQLQWYFLCGPAVNFIWETDLTWKNKKVKIDDDLKKINQAILVA